MSVGNWIVIVFLAFTLFIGSLVLICMRQDTGLVSSDYYQKEQQHQQKMEYINNANTLPDLPEITFSARRIRVAFNRFDQLETGMLHLLRPSNHLLDRTFPLHSSSDTVQYFLLSNWQRGLYRISMQWRMQGKDFYVERAIVL